MPLKKAERKEEYTAIMALMLQGKSKEAFDKLRNVCAEDTGLFTLVDYDKALAKLDSLEGVKKHFLYDPENGFETFPTKEECDKEAESAIQNYLDDGWDDSVVNVVTGVITHSAMQIDRVDRPQDLDEEGCDGNGEYWSDEWAYKCNYALKPISELNPEH